MFLYNIFWGWWRRNFRDERLKRRAIWEGHMKNLIQHKLDVYTYEGSQNESPNNGEVTPNWTSLVTKWSFQYWEWITNNQGAGQWGTMGTLQKPKLLPRQGIAPHNLTATLYCWRQYLCKSLNMENLRCSQPRDFTLIG